MILIVWCMNCSGLMVERSQDVLDEFGSHFGTIADGINRILLGDVVFAATQKRLTLESILHPMIRQHRDTFIAEQRKV